LAAFIGFLSNRRSVLERQVAERTAKLKESEARFRNLFENSPVAYQSLDESGCYLELNSELCDLLGYHREDLLGRSFAEVWPPEARHLFQEKFAHFRNSGHIESELELVRRDGTPVTVLLVGRIQRDADGNFVRTHCILHNITERKRAEQTIKLNEGRLASLLRISQYNPASIADLFECALDEAITLTASRIGYILLYDEATQEFSMNTFSKEVMKECRLEPQITFKLAHAGLWGEVVRRGGPVIINDFQAPNPWKKGYPEGHVKLEKFLSVPVFSGNRVVMVVAVGNKETDYSITDIRQLTLMMNGVWRIIERKRMEEELRRYRDHLERLVEERTGELTEANRRLQVEIMEHLRTEMALRESEARFRAIFEGAPVGIGLWDLEGRFLEGNSAMTAMLGYSLEELRHLDPAENLVMRQALFGEVLRGRREFFEGEDRCRRRDGSLIWVWVHISPIRSATGEILFALVMLKDITQEKQIQTELSAYQQRLRCLASELSLTEERERRRVAADLHDHIGQVLALTQIKLGALRQGASSSLDMEALAEIREHIGEAIRYTRSLTFELGLPVLYDLGLEAAVEWLADRFQEEHGLEIHIQADGLPKPLSEAAKVMVFRVLRELLANVVKHAQASRVDISVVRDGEFISLGVRDNGIGFDPAEAGARLSRPDAFGLFSIRERLNHLGGHLEVSSAPGRGTSAYIMVPLEKNILLSN
jgi:PAS domain S-box-containing protein